MAQNITLLGASYQNVPAVNLPKTGGGTARFDDTSDADATAGDIASGKTAYVNGVKLTGTGSGGVTPTGNINITQSGETDVTNYATATVPAASFWTQAEDMGFTTVSNQRVWRMKGITELDPGEGDVEGWISSGTYAGNVQSYNAVPANTTITPSTSAQTVGGAKYMMEGAVTVAAMPSGTAGTPTATKGAVVNNSVTITPSVTNTTGYITGGTKTGTAVTVSASELVSGTLYCDEADTWNVTNAANFVVGAGTEGTPTATKSTVSNHSVSVTPSVTNTEGWITGSTKTGTAVTVSASELVSGTYTVDSSGTKDVTNYASASVPAGTAGTPSASKGTVSNHSVSVTPSVTNQTGWIVGSTKTGTAVTVSASELVSGSETKTENGTYDVTNLASLIVNVASGSSKNVQVIQSTSRTTATSLTKTSGEITVSKTGTYDVYWSGCRTNTSSSYTWGTRLYIGSTAYGTENTTWSNNCQSNHLTNVSLTKNQKISVYARGRGGSYYAMVPMLLIIES